MHECPMYLSALTMAVVVNEKILDATVQGNPLDRLLLLLGTSAERPLTSLHIFPQLLFYFLGHLPVVHLDIPVSTYLLPQQLLEL